MGTMLQAISAVSGYVDQSGHAHLLSDKITLSRIPQANRAVVTKLDGDEGTPTGETSGMQEGQPMDSGVILPSIEDARGEVGSARKTLTINVGFPLNPDGSENVDAVCVIHFDEELPIDEYGRHELQMEQQILLAQGGNELLRKTTVKIRADVEVPCEEVLKLIGHAESCGFIRFALLGAPFRHR